MRLRQNICGSQDKAAPGFKEFGQIKFFGTRKLCSTSPPAVSRWTHSLDVQYALVILARDQRRIPHVAVTAHPTAAWTAK